MLLILSKYNFVVEMCTSLGEAWAIKNKGVDERVIKIHSNVRNPLLSQLLKAFLTDRKIMQVH